MLELDHLAIACTDLTQGADWLRAQLGVDLRPGGAHQRYGTHNMLLGLGDIYLELIAPDPAATPDVPRWFGLDHFTGSPRPANWICRTTDFAAAPAMTGPPRDMSRGALTWQITVPDDGSLPMNGAYPTLLQWAPGVTPPADTLPDSGIRLIRWDVSHPMADVIADDLLLDDPRVTFTPGAPGFSATFDTAKGEVTL